MRIYTLLASAALFYASAAVADGSGTLRLASGVQKVALLELYTSEGCSSCPPADRWLSGLKSDERLWTEVVPIALHVDYWNYIGWEDRFAHAGHTERQRRYVRNGAARAVYTPGFFSGGEEWLGWFDDTVPVSDEVRAGILSLEVNNADIAIRFDPSGEIASPLEVTVAILGMQLQSEVLAGENKGKILKHDFVALELQSVALQPDESGYRAMTRLHAVESDAASLALVAWVSTPDDQSPLQAVGGYLPFKIPAL